MKFKLLLFILTLFISVSVSAKPIFDSVGVKNNDGKKMVLFKVKAKDTYYSIGHRYNVKPETLMKFNGSKKATLSIGAIINVPTDIPYKKAKDNGETTKEKKERLAEEAKKERLAEEAKREKRHAKKAEEAAQQDQAAAQEAPERVSVQVQQPVQQPAQQVQQPVQQQDNIPPTQYKVSAGETLYAISKRFNTTVDAVSKLNNLSSTNLRPGQILLIPAGVTAPPVAALVVPAAVVQAIKRDSPSVVAINKDSSLAAERRLNANRYGIYEKNEKGVATWIDDTSLDPSKKLVLHKTAPIGTVIKITNPMTNRTTFAKVVGRFTESESTRDVIIVMTKNVADALGALDKRFHVNISYGSPNE